MLLAYQAIHNSFVNSEPAAMHQYRMGNKFKLQGYMWNKYRDAYAELYKRGIHTDIANTILEEAEDKYEPRYIPIINTWENTLRFGRFGRIEFSFIWLHAGPTFPLNDALEWQLTTMKYYMRQLINLCFVTGYNDPTILSNGNLLFKWPTNILLAKSMGMDVIFPTYSVFNNTVIRVTIRKYHIKGTEAETLWNYTNEHERDGIHWFGWDNAVHGVEVRQKMLNGDANYTLIRTISLEQAINGDGAWFNFLKYNI